MPQVLSQGNCQYTVISGTGTTTLNPGQTSGPPVAPGVLFGAQMTGVGTSFAFTFIDVVPAAGNVAVATNTLLNGTGTAIGQRFIAGFEGVGVRYKGALCVVTTGTAGSYNALWD